MSEISTPDELIKPVVQLVGIDGNAYSIMGEVKSALTREGNSNEIVEDYLSQAMSGDYDHLLAVSLAFIKLPEAP